MATQATVARWRRWLANALASAACRLMDASYYLDPLPIPAGLRDRIAASMADAQAGHTVDVPFIVGWRDYV